MSFVLVRPRIDNLPQDVIEQIVQLENKFNILQLQLTKLQPDIDPILLPHLEISDISEKALIFNRIGLQPEERCLQMLKYAKDFSLDV